MKPFALFSCAVMCLLASCSGDENPDSISRLDYIEIRGELNGLDYDIAGDIDQELLTVTLDHHIADGTPVVFTFGASGAVYYDSRIIQSEHTEVEFRKNKVIAIVSANGNPVSYKFVIPGGPDEDKDGSNQITQFALRLTRSGQTTTHTGIINHQKGIITIEAPGLGWIEDIHQAVAEFSSTGVSVDVGDEPQSSGVTANNFMADVVYTVCAENGDTRDYTVNVIAPQSTGLPVVRIDTEGGAGINDKENYVNSAVSIYGTGDADSHIIESAAGVRGRGNSTWNYAKKPYRIKFDKKTSVFGLEKAKSWVLLANWQDPTYIMNTVAFEISRRLGLAFTPTPNHVELFLNGSYKGSYVLCEQMQVGSGRVDIDESDDVFLELDSNYDEDYKFRSDQINMPVNIKSPEFEDVPVPEREAIIAEIKADYDKMEKAVLELSGWREYLDVASFIDFMIVNEITRNTELGHPKSTFLYKQGDGKWTWGPVWDFDWAYGYTGGQNYWSSAQTHLYKGSYSVDDKRPGINFFNKLFQDDGFKKEYKERWNQIKPLIADIDVFVGEMGALLAASDTQNKRVWGSQYTKDYAGQIASMQSWLSTRIAYLDSVVAKY